MSPEMLTAIIASILTFLTVVANGVFQSQREKRRDALTVENRRLDIAERAETAAHVVAKIDENTEVSVKAFDTANNVNDKIATVAVQANEHAVNSMDGVMRELASLKKMVADLARRRA
jgi:uncharacterized membrane protein YhiD involved in acid resistance